MSFVHHTGNTGPALTPRQEELLDELEKLMTTEGFRNLTLSDMSDHLHCSRRTLYELAPTKDDLVALVVSRFLDRNYQQGIEAMAPHGTASGRIEGFTRAVVEDAHRTSVAFADDTFRSARTASLIANYDQRCVSLVENLIRSGQNDGELRGVHATLAAEGLMAGIARVQDNTVLSVLGLNYGQAVTQIVDIFLDGIRQRRNRPAD